MRDRYLFTIMLAGHDMYVLDYVLSEVKQKNPNQISIQKTLVFQANDLQQCEKAKDDFCIRIEMQIVIWSCKPVWKWHRALGVNWKPTTIYLARGNVTQFNQLIRLRQKE